MLIFHPKMNHISIPHPPPIFKLAPPVSRMFFKKTGTMYCAAERGGQNGFASFERMKNMNRLTCQVETCRHNARELCLLSHIQVDGPVADESRETCCSSYAERTESTQNSVDCGCTASEQTDIHCSAEHCVYNENKKCHAEQVQVGCCCAAPTVMSETECCTFRARG